MRSLSINEIQVISGGFSAAKLTSYLAGLGGAVLGGYGGFVAPFYMAHMLDPTGFVTAAFLSYGGWINPWTTLTVLGCASAVIGCGLGYMAGRFLMDSSIGFVEPIVKEIMES